MANGKIPYVQLLIRRRTLHVHSVIYLVVNGKPLRFVPYTAIYE